MRDLKMPDITPAQVGAVLTMIVGYLVGFGVMSEGSAEMVVSLGTTLVSAALMIADAVIRNGRSKVAAAKQGVELADPVVND